jgi:hypothetical protein
MATIDDANSKADSKYTSTTTEGLRVISAQRAVAANFWATARLIFDLNVLSGRFA